MTTTGDNALPGHRAAIVELRGAIKATGADPSPATLARLDAALADLPLGALDDSGERTVRAALGVVSQAEDSPLFAYLEKAQKAVAEMLSKGPSALPVHTHPAVLAVLELVGPCYALPGDWEKGSADRRAWDRAAEASFELLRGVTSFLYSEGGKFRVHRALEACSVAVRRAVAYRALFWARHAAVKAAQGMGVFVIGGRQPLPDEFHGAWTQVLGSATYRFDVTPPDLLGGAPYGHLVVTRLSEDADGADDTTVHTLALTDRGWSGGADSVISEALYAI
ncbi:hypothetical protein AB0G49_14200 [Streptomyces longwoodensis]|uniref:hypothetical protein n=1 Tax=Streptomyces longwoodensis TaxID=68231 RepID=UPI0034023393